MQKEALKNPSLLGHMGYLSLSGLHMFRLMITFALWLAYFIGEGYSQNVRSDSIASSS
jgi:hypothetical protein